MTTIVPGSDQNSSPDELREAVHVMNCPTEIHDAALAAAETWEMDRLARSVVEIAFKEATRRLEELRREAEVSVREGLITKRLASLVAAFAGEEP
jgi:hypothetical protein